MPEHQHCDDALSRGSGDHVVSESRPPVGCGDCGCSEDGQRWQGIAYHLARALRENGPWGPGLSPAQTVACDALDAFDEAMKKKDRSQGS